MLYEKGETLVPHADFYMDTGERSFTQELSYIIIAVRGDRYLFIDDQEDEHLMSASDTAGWRLQP